MKSNNEVNISLFNPKNIDKIFYIGFLFITISFFLPIFKIVKIDFVAILIPIWFIFSFLSLFLEIQNVKVFNNLNGIGYFKEINNENIYIGPKITIDRNGKITMPYQRIKTELTEKEKNFGLKKVLYLDYSDVSEKTHISLYERDIKKSYFAELIRDFTGQKPSIILQNIKKLQLNKKELKEMLDDLYKIKEINYKDHVSKFEKQPVIYQEKDIYGQISNELEKTKKNILK